MGEQNYISMDIIPLVERCMTRFLWKIVQLEEGCWIVPTKRLVVAILMGGRIGFPRVLFEPIEHMIATGARLSNRIPYEIPMHFIGSFYPLNAHIYLAPCHNLQSQNLLELYDDKYDEHTLLEKLGLDYKKLLPGRQSMINDLDAMDKFMGDFVEAFIIANNMPQYLAAVIDAADRYNGYPVVYHTDICERALKDLVRPTHALLALERRLLKALPNHVVLFRNLKDIVNSDAHVELRQLVLQLVNREQRDDKTGCWDEAILLARNQIAKVGTPYEALAFGDVKRLPKDSRVPILHDCMPAEEVVNRIIDDAAVRLHKNVCASKCLVGNANDIDLLTIFSSHVWLDAVNMADMLRMIGGFPAANADIISGCAPIY